MFAFKFLGSGAVAPISRRPWPRPTGDGPGAWLEAVGPLAPCTTGVHACRAEDLAHWLYDELWIVELDGDWIVGEDAVVARRGRLVRAIDGWRGELGARFAVAASEHARAIVEAAPPARREAVATYLAVSSQFAAQGNPVVAAYTAAVAVARLGDPADIGAAYRRERAYQSALLAGAADPDGLVR